MNALLGVGQGSIRVPVVILEWNGSSKKNKPVAFVGKGFVLTPGISLKPAKFMEDMTYDIGSAVVVGLMKEFALESKFKCNWCSGVSWKYAWECSKTDDIVKSYSGKTIEVLNTDAEGRLVLADALTYAEKHYKPKFIINLATLTGAIIVSLDLNTQVF